MRGEHRPGELACCALGTIETSSSPRHSIVLVRRTNTVGLPHLYLTCSGPARLAHARPMLFIRTQISMTAVGAKKRDQAGHCKSEDSVDNERIYTMRRENPEITNVYLTNTVLACIIVVIVCFAPVLGATHLWKPMMRLKNSKERPSSC